MEINTPHGKKVKDLTVFDHIEVNGVVYDLRCLERKKDSTGKGVVVIKYWNWKTEKPCFIEVPYDEAEKYTTEIKKYKHYMSIDLDGYRNTKAYIDLATGKSGTMEDNVNHPSHYTWLKELCGIEVLDITRHLDFDTGNAIKYLLRAGRKDPKKTIEDLEKAVFYINDKINMLKNENK